jgi:hypothetical protein
VRGHALKHAPRSRPSPQPLTRKRSAPNLTAHTRCVCLPRQASQSRRGSSTSTCLQWICELQHARAHHHPRVWWALRAVTRSGSPSSWRFVGTRAVTRSGSPSSSRPVGKRDDHHWWDRFGSPSSSRFVGTRAATRSGSPSSASPVGKRDDHRWWDRLGSRSCPCSAGQRAVTRSGPPSCSHRRRSSPPARPPLPPRCYARASTPPECAVA